MIFDRKQQLTVCLNQGRLVGWIRAVGGCTTFGGGTVKNTLKRDGAENRGGDKLVQGVGALKRGGGGLEPRYELWTVNFMEKAVCWKCILIWEKD